MLDTRDGPALCGGKTVMKGCGKDKSVDLPRMLTLLYLVLHRTFIWHQRSLMPPMIDKTFPKFRKVSYISLPTLKTS